MPLSDPVKRKKYHADLMRRRREELKSGTPEGFQEAEPSAPPAAVAISPTSPEEIALGVSSITMDKLKYGYGWCIWYLPQLDTRVVIIRDETVGGFPEGLPTFTPDEINEFAEMQPSTQRLIIATKNLDPRARIQIKGGLIKNGTEISSS